jgi:hypothetical protein
LPGYPEILVISNIVEDGRPIGLADAGRVAVSHTDTSYRKSPSAGSALYALEIPRNDAGEAVGDALFASTFLAYDALSDAMKRRLTGLKAVHHMTKGYDGAADAPPTRIKYDESQRDQVPDQARPLIPGRAVRQPWRALYVAHRRPHRPQVFAARQRARDGRQQADAADHHLQQQAPPRVQGRANVERARL